MMLCSSGFYIAFYLSLQSIKHTQRQIILSSDLKDKYIFEFSFSKEEANSSGDFSFVEKDEIKFKGKMYDIVTLHSTADSFYIKCIVDENEEYMKELASNAIIKQQTAKNERSLSFLQLRLGFFTINSFDPFVKTFSIQKAVAYNCFLPGELSKPDINIPSPPPWYCLS